MVLRWSVIAHACGMRGEFANVAPDATIQRTTLGTSHKKTKNEKKPRSCEPTDEERERRATVCKGL